MSQVLNQEATQTEEFYKREVYRMLNEIRGNNEKMELDQAEIDCSKERSAENLRRIEIKIQAIENLVM